jgi:hypothetical protein
VKKNLFDINNNSSVDHGLQSSQVCEPCAAECEKVNRKVNKRKLSDLNDTEVAHILDVFDKKD